MSPISSSPGTGRAVRVNSRPGTGRELVTRYSSGPNEVEHGTLAPYFRLLELSGGNRPIKCGTQVLRRLQRQLDASARAGIERRVVEVERDDIAQWRMARVVIGNHRMR